MADYFTALSALFPVRLATNVAPALAIYHQLEEELDADGETIGFDAEADEPPDGANLWLHADDHANPEHVITFALRCAETLDLTGLWGFRWSLFCSKLRDGYGGGAQLLDLGGRRTVSCVDCEHWLEDEIDRRSGPRCTATAILEECEVAKSRTTGAKADLLLAFVDREIADDPAVAERFRVFLAEVSADPGEMICRECGPPMFIEENGVSHHAGGGLDGIDYDVDLQHVAVAGREP